MSSQGQRVGGRTPVADPFVLLSRLRTRIYTLWLRLTYPFARFGGGVSIHHSCYLSRTISNRIQIGDYVSMEPEVWLATPERAASGPPVIVLDSRCKIGRRSMLTARNLIQIDQDVLIGPSVLIADHSHEFFDVNAPIHTQGLTHGGTVRIERNCWLGYGAAVISTSGDLVIGKNSIVGANSVVTRSVPPFSVVVGNPARIVKQYDPDTASWMRPK